MTNRPLSGLRVLDLTTIVVGPTATLRLADFGAEIIKIEPLAGDNLRSLGGPSPSRAMSGKYMHFNRDKRAVCMDLKHPLARRALARLVADCDVLVSNMRPTALERLGLDPVTTAGLNPRLIHCTITGFGQNGPYAGAPAYDTVVQGVSGITGLFEQRDGEPCYVPMVICDHTCGEVAATSICAALLGRERTGQGVVIEIPMFETMAAYVLQENMGAASFDPPLGPPGDMRVLNPANRPVRTADGHISLSANTDAQAAGFLRAVGRPDLIADPRFLTVADRVRNAGDWFAFRASALLQRPTDHWLAAFAHEDVPAMRCHTLETLLDDPHLAAVGLIGRESHPTDGEVRTLRSTVLFGGEPLPAGHAARPMGWDTCAVLAEAGLGAAEIGEMIAQGAAVDGRGDRS